MASYPGCKRAFYPLTWSRSRNSCRGLFLTPPNQLKPRVLFSNAEEHKERERSLLALDRCVLAAHWDIFNPLNMTQFPSCVFFSSWVFGGWLSLVGQCSWVHSHPHALCATTEVHQVQGTRGKELPALWDEHPAHLFLFPVSGPASPPTLFGVLWSSQV